MNKFVLYGASLIALLIIGGVLAYLSYSKGTEPEADGECRKRFFYPSKIDAKALDSFVCVCTASSCDKAPPIGTLNKQDELVVFQSTLSRDRLRRFTTNFHKASPVGASLPINITVDANQQYQTILGFGGSFTDAAGINIKSLSKAVQQTLLESYFGEGGLQYTMCRVPIASTDFSTHVYSYLDGQGDFECSNFSLTPEDFDYKIPIIHKAMDLANRKLKLFASSWSAPSWMKTNEDMGKFGSLKGELNGQYYETYAKYLVRFFDEYSKHNIEFWGLTVQNEPLRDTKFQSMNFTAKMEKAFATQLLKPIMMDNRATKHLKLITYDDTRDDALEWAKEVYSNLSSDSDVYDGFAVHWYIPDHYEELREIHRMRPDKFIFSSESCAGYWPGEHKPFLGDWGRGQQYGHDIINTLRNWGAGWVDWNLALDMQGGPNWVNNFVDAPVIVNAPADEFLKQPMYYFMAHFSKFIPPGSIRIASDSSSILSDSAVEHVAFVTSDGTHVLVVMNANAEYTFELLVRDVGIEDKFGQILLESNSIVTVIWKP